MTFEEIKTEISERLNLRQPATLTRIGREINQRYKRLTGDLGIVPSRRTTKQATATLGDRYLTFTGTEKVLAVFDTTDDGMRVLEEITFDEMRQLVPVDGDTAAKYAIASHTATSVTIIMDCNPQSEFELNADVIGTTSTLSGSMTPDLPESFHDILVAGVMSDELRKKGEYADADTAEEEYERRYRKLKNYLAGSAYLKLQQNKGASRNTSSPVATGGGTGTTGGSSWTQTGLITFDRDPSAPFAVAAGSAKVANLDADLLDGMEPADIAALAGDCDGPASSTDNAIARFDGAGGKTLQNSGITIADGATGTLAGSNSGDVTLAGSPNYLTIVGQAITRALIDLTSHVTGRLPFANFVAATATSRIVARKSASSGSFEECTLSELLDFVGSPAQGDILYRNGTVWTRLGAGTSGQFLQTQGAAADPVWATPTSGISILDRDVTVTDVVSTAAETTVYTFSVPGNTLSTNKAIRLTLVGDYLNNSGGARNLTVRVKFGGTTLASGAVLTIAANANRGAQFLQTIIVAENATNAQRAFTTWEFSDGAENNNAGTLTNGAGSAIMRGAHNGLAIDSTSSQTLTVTAQHDISDANASFRCHAVLVELLG